MKQKLDYEQLEKEILADKLIKSEYQQATIIIVRDIFKKLSPK